MVLKGWKLNCDSPSVVLDIYGRQSTGLSGNGGMFTQEVTGRSLLSWISGEAKPPDPPISCRWSHKRKVEVSRMSQSSKGKIKKI